MTSTNAPDRLPPHQAPDRIHRIGTRLRIARPIRQKYAVRLQRQHIFCRSLRRNYRHFPTFAAQLAQHILFYSEVLGNAVQARRLIFPPDPARPLAPPPPPLPTPTPLAASP